MATIEDTPCVGIMLVRKVYLDKTARLQMLIGQDPKHFVTIPKGKSVPQTKTTAAVCNEVKFY